MDLEGGGDLPQSWRETGLVIAPAPSVSVGYSSAKMSSGHSTTMMSFSHLDAKMRLREDHCAKDAGMAMASMSNLGGSVGSNSPHSFFGSFARGDSALVVQPTGSSKRTVMCEPFAPMRSPLRESDRMGFLVRVGPGSSKAICSTPSESSAHFDSAPTHSFIPTTGRDSSLSVPSSRRDSVRTARRDSSLSFTGGKEGVHTATNNPRGPKTLRAERLGVPTVTRGRGNFGRPQRGGAYEVTPAPSIARDQIQLQQCLQQVAENRAAMRGANEQMDMRLRELGSRQESRDNRFAAEMGQMRQMLKSTIETLQLTSGHIPNHVNRGESEKSSFYSGPKKFGR